MFVQPEPAGLSLEQFLGADLARRVRVLRLDTLRWVERRRYTVDCNWKVFVDNYLDGGYHVPHLHKGLDSVLDYKRLHHRDRRAILPAVEPDRRRRAIRAHGPARSAPATGRSTTGCTRTSCSTGTANAMDTNLVLPLGLDTTEVVFDFYFADVADARGPRNQASIAVSERIQDEDDAICASVQRGLGSRAYSAGRLSVRREAGEHLFHRLLHADLRAGLET